MMLRNAIDFYCTVTFYCLKLYLINFSGCKVENNIEYGYI